MTESTKCSICRENTFRKLSIGSVEHKFCAFHAGFIRGLEGLFKKHHSHWSFLND